jgi:hypothetical protein
VADILKQLDFEREVTRVLGNRMRLILDFSGDHLSNYERIRDFEILSLNLDTEIIWGGVHSEDSKLMKEIALCAQRVY